MLKNLISWKKNNGLRNYGEKDVFADFHKKMNKLFDNFFDEHTESFGLPSILRNEDNWFKTPEIDVSENDKEIKVEANLPGLDEKEIKVSLEGDRLVIEGEKCEEKDNKDKKYFISERRCGKFQRVIPLPENTVNKDNIKAELKKGVLKITLPKLHLRESAGKKIEIKTE